MFKNKKFISISIVGIVLGVVLVSASLPAKNHEKNNKNLNDLDLSKYNSNFKNYNQKISIIDNNQKIIAKFNIAVADTPEKQQYGLMELNKLPQNLGMIFLQNQPKKIMMWMKNTKIPLDMIFIDENFYITHIKKNAEPYSTEVIKSPFDAIAVLEINGGFADKLNIQNGHKLIFNND